MPPHLLDCTEEQWASVLPGVRRPPESVHPALQAYAKAIRKQVSKGIIPGFCSIAIWRDQVLHVDAHGYADLQEKRPMRTDTILRLYCTTKSIIALGVMLLVDRGRCTLEDEVSKFIPAFANVRVVVDAGQTKSTAKDTRPQKKMTLRHLLTHTSGLGYGKELNLPPECPAEVATSPLVQAVERGAVRNIADFCEQLAALPLRRDPGKAFEYSYGLDVLGRVIEVASGQPLDEFLEGALFKPLGMVDTGFCVPEHNVSRLATLYGNSETAELLGKPPGREPTCVWELFPLDRGPDSAWTQGRHCPVLSGGGIMGHYRGGLVSTLNDLCRLFLMVSNGGQLPGAPRLLQEATVKQMVDCDLLTRSDCLGQQQTNTGLGGVNAEGAFGWNAMGELGVVSDPKKLSAGAFEFGEYGYGGLAETFWSINPDRELIIVWLTQQVDNHSWTESQPKANLWTAARKVASNLASGERAVAKKPAAGFPVAEAQATVEPSSSTARSRSPRGRRLRKKTHSERA